MGVVVNAVESFQHFANHMLRNSGFQDGVISTIDTMAQVKVMMKCCIGEPFDLASRCGRGPNIRERGSRV